ncbi:hypothetical protein, partial [Streptomyces galilaeus]|uniref:hypothetical protein n=1 Tax=Streptomyces galilaeus TaxID=33899 RepID=UPI0038F61BA0
EYKDSDDERNLNPRYRSKPHFVDTEGNDTEQEHDTSIFGLNSPQDENGGVTQKVVDFYSAGMDNGGGELDDFEWNHLRRDNPYPNLPA